MTKNIEEWYNEVVKKLLSLEYLIQFITTIHNEDAEYFESTVKLSDFFYTSHRSAVKVIIIDFITLTNHAENYNFSTLLNYLARFHGDIMWKNETSLRTIKLLRKDFSAIINSDVYHKLKNTRDKYYAHDVINKHEFQIDVPYESIWKLIRECQRIFNVFSFHYNGSTYAFNFTQKHHELEALHRFYQIQDFVFSEFKKSHDLGRLKRVYEIAWNVSLD